MIKFFRIVNDEIIYINKNCIVSVCEHNYKNEYSTGIMTTIKEYSTGITTTNGEYIVVKGKLEDIVKQIEEGK